MSPDLLRENENADNAWNVDSVDLYSFSRRDTVACYDSRPQTKLLVDNIINGRSFLDSNISSLPDSPVSLRPSTAGA